MNKILNRIFLLTNVQVLIGGLIFAALYYFAIYDDGSALDTQIVKVNSDINVETKKKMDVDATLAEKSRMEKSVVALSEQYAIVSKKLPSSLTSIEVNRSIDQYAKNSGVTIKGRRPGIATSREVVEEVPVEVTIEGGYSEITHFMYLISSIERLTKVSNFTLDKLDDTQTSGKIRFTGSVVGFKLAPAKEAKPGTAGQPATGQANASVKPAARESE